MKIGNAALVLAVMIGLFVAGCEPTTTPDSAITVTPPSADLAQGTTQVFVAGAADSNVVLNLPLVWTVSDSSLGTIQASEGLTAVYEAAGGSGNNSITVRDQGDASGVAAVSQH